MAPAKPQRLEPNPPILCYKGRGSSLSIANPRRPLSSLMSRRRRSFAFSMRAFEMYRSRPEQKGLRVLDTLDPPDRVGQTDPPRQNRFFRAR